MNGKMRFLALLPLAMFLLCITPGYGLCADAAPPVLDHAGLQALVKETQRENQSPRELGLVWWIPTLYWRASIAASDPNASKDQLEQFDKVLSPYTLVAAVQGEMGPLGGVMWKSEDILRSNLALVDRNGKEYRPIAISAVTPDARNLISILRPVIANMLGPMGEHLYFVYFPSLTDGKTPIADPLAEGSFAIRLGKETHKWRLPLGALLPKKQCPVDGETFSGAFKYCPFHGKELVLAPANR
ncbi:MAG: hypothetical protein HY896_03365 [Deltaproteobacteria bacterium]|nr:hypothetical protein [Deltaproteobacteria bacterium]